MQNKINKNNNPSLFVIATPIGNLKDITLRAIETLEKVEVLLCEDTRKTGLLLQKLEIKNKPKLVRYDLVKENKITENVIEMFKDHQNIGICSDAGTPIISDPGFPLIKEAKNKKINIVVIPGAIAYTTALVISGFGSKNIFKGFMPDKKSKIEKEILEHKETKEAIVYYVSCYKINKVLEIYNELTPNANIFVAKELTKLHETHYWGKPQEIKEIFPEKPKGEYVLIVKNTF